MDKKIALFIRSLHKGGAEKQSILFAKHLSKYYPTYLIVFYEEGEYIKLAREFNINLIGLKGNYIKKTISLYYFLKRKKIDVLLNYLPSNNILGGIIGKFANVDRVYGGLRRDNINDSKIKMIIQKNICNYFSTGFIANSYSTKKVYSNVGFKKIKISVIHNCIETNEQLPTKKHKDFITIVSVGRFVKEKDYFTAINAIHHLLKSDSSYNKKIVYNIIGYGEQEEEIKHYLAQLGLVKNIKIFDGRSDVTTYYKQADIYLSTSLYEGMSNTVMEAMNYGLPIVSTDSGDIRFLVKDDYNGYICPQKAPEQIAEKLKLFIDNKELINTMGKNSYKHIKNNFSVEIYVKNYLNLIENNKLLEKNQHLNLRDT